MFGGLAPASDPDQAERLELAEERFGDARSYVGAGISEPSLEVGGGRATLDQAERRDGQP